MSADAEQTAHTGERGREGRESGGDIILNTIGSGAALGDSLSSAERYWSLKSADTQSLSSELSLTNSSESLTETR